MDKTPKLPPNLPPNNIRTTFTEGMELRKLWNIPTAEYMYVLATRVKIETASLNPDNTPNWDKITNTEYKWQVPQQYIGDEKWAKATAEHFKLDFPTEEYQPTEEDQ